MADERELRRIGKRFSSRLQSPFVFEDYVPRDKFFDRDVELEFFYRNVSVKRKILLCIVAPLKYGKTSLMRRYYEMVQEFDDVIPIYIDLKKKDKPIKFMVEELKKFDIDVVAGYRRCLREGSLDRLFDEINEIMIGKDEWLFLFFDEFHLLPSRLRTEGFYREFGDVDIFGFMRGFAEGARISYIVCGSVIEPLMHALDVWGGRFQMIYLGPFNEKDAIYMVKKLFAEGDMDISDEYAKIVTEAAGYHPFYIQYMCHQIYTAGEINRATIREAKQRLFEFLSPIFSGYLERIREIGKEYIEALKKLMRNEPLTIDDRVCLGRLMRMGILKPKNARFEFVDPLFRRYMEQIIENLEPLDIIVVGHWAERIVGNYLLRKGYIPYYSHDSRGAFDIYVKIEKWDVGIQVRYSTSDTIYISKEDAERIEVAAKENNWIPIIALVSKQLRFFPEIRPRKYRGKEGYEDIIEAIRKAFLHKQ